jgi:uncharacterized membrane protein
MNKLFQYFLIVIILALVDLPYLYLNRNIFQNVTRSISGKSFTNRYYSALLVYLAIALGIVVLVLPNIRTNTNTTILSDVVIYGGIFGIVSYAIFDFTMHFMFDGWTLGIALMDTLWGGILCSISTLIIVYLCKLH